MSVDIRDRIRSLKQKVAVISGGGGGFGLAIAEALAEFEAVVVLLDVSPARVANAEAAIRGAGGEAIGLVSDVTRSEDISAAVSEVGRRFGRIDILVNNVGSVLGLRKPFEDSTEDEWERLYRTNLWHMFALTHRALPLLKQAGPGGSVINVSTIEAFRGYPMGTPYSAFKAGVTGFTRSLALELSNDGIRVNAIAPETSTSWSNHYETWLPEAERDQVANWIPLGRFGTSEDAAACALFLASDLSAWVTGTTIHLDGGALAAGGFVRTNEGRWTHRPTITGTRWPPHPDS